MRKNVFSLAISLLFFSSCMTTNTITPNSNYSNIKIANSDIIFIAMPRDGGYGNDIVSGSGRTTLSKLQYVLEDYARKIYTGTMYEQLEDCKNTAIEKNAKYLFFPTIVNWEDRATAWSGLPDRVEIKMVIYDLEKDQIVYSTLLRSKGTSVTMKSTDPSELLLDLFGGFVKQIY